MSRRVLRLKDVKEATGAVGEGLLAGLGQWVRLATWEEMDLDTLVWTIPASRMKTAREHRVPLSDPGIG